MDDSKYSCNSKTIKWYLPLLLVVIMSYIILFMCSSWIVGEFLHKLEIMCPYSYLTPFRIRGKERGNGNGDKK